MYAVIATGSKYREKSGNTFVGPVIMQTPKTSAIFTTLRHIGQFQLTFNVWELIQLGKEPVIQTLNYRIHRAFVKCQPYTRRY